MGKSDGLCVTIDWVCGSGGNCQQMPFWMEFQQFEMVLTVMNCAAYFGGGGPNPVLDLDLASPVLFAVIPLTQTAEAVILFNE